MDRWFALLFAASLSACASGAGAVAPGPKEALSSAGSPSPELVPEPARSSSEACGQRFAPAFVELGLQPADAGGPAEFGTPMGLEIADMDGDGHADIVLITGNDQEAVDDAGKGRGRVSVLYGPFLEGRPRARWLSEASGFFRRLAVGDLDGDHRLDIAVSLGNPLDERDRPNVGIYLSGGQPRGYTAQAMIPNPPGSPEARVPDATSVSLGDIDHDGYLDVGVAQMDINTGSNVPRVPYVLLNDPTGASRFQQIGWKPLQEVGGLKSRFTDVDGDALLDLVLTTHDDVRPTEWARVYRGCIVGADPLEDCKTGLRRAPDVQVRPFGIECDDVHVRCASHPLDFDVARGVELQPQIGVGLNAERCWDFVQNAPNVQCRAPSNIVWTYSGGRVQYDERRDDPNMVAVVQWLDGERPGTFDLLSAQWDLLASSKTLHREGPLRLYCGDQSGLAERPATLGDRALTTQAVAVGALFGDDVVQMASTTLATEHLTLGGYVWFLPHRRPVGLARVQKNGRVLQPGIDYHWLPSEGWVGFKDAVVASDRVDVDYFFASTPTVVVGDERHADRLFALPPRAAP